MTPAEGLEYLEREIDARISSFGASRRFYRRGSLFQTVATSALGALTTLAVGLDQIYASDALAALSLALAGLTTVAAAATGWFSFQKRWVTSQRTLNRLYALRSHIHYLRAVDNSAVDKAAVDGFYERYQGILDEANAEWEDARTASQ
jgi:hypothetical protein